MKQLPSGALSRATRDFGEAVSVDDYRLPPDPSEKLAGRCGQVVPAVTDDAYPEARRVGAAGEQSTGQYLQVGPGALQVGDPGRDAPRSGSGASASR